MRIVFGCRSTCLTELSARKPFKVCFDLPASEREYVFQPFVGLLLVKLVALFFGNHRLTKLDREESQLK